MTFCWYCPNPSHWIRCEITGRFFGAVTAVLYDGTPISGHVRKIADAEIVE